MEHHLDAPDLKDYLFAVNHKASNHRIIRTNSKAKGNVTATFQIFTSAQQLWGRSDSLFRPIESAMTHAESSYNVQIHMYSDPVIYSSFPANKVLISGNSLKDVEATYKYLCDSCPVMMLTATKATVESPDNESCELDGTGNNADTAEYRAPDASANNLAQPRPRPQMHGDISFSNPDSNQAKEQQNMQSETELTEIPVTLTETMEGHAPSVSEVKKYVSYAEGYETKKFNESSHADTKRNMTHSRMETVPETATEADSDCFGTPVTQEVDRQLGNAADVSQKEDDSTTVTLIPESEMDHSDNQNTSIASNFDQSDTLVNDEDLVDPMLQELPLDESPIVCPIVSARSTQSQDTEAASSKVRNILEVEETVKNLSPERVNEITEDVHFEQEHQLNLSSDEDSLLSSICSYNLGTPCSTVKDFHSSQIFKSDDTQTGSFVSEIVEDLPQEDDQTSPWESCSDTDHIW